MTILITSCILLFGCVQSVNVNETSEVNELAKVTKVTEQTEVRKKQVMVQDDKLLHHDIFPITIQDYIMNDFSEPEAISREVTIINYLALGDSLTRGVGDEEKKNGYTKRLAEKIEQNTEVIKVELDNRGKRGRRSDQLLKLIEKGHYDKEIQNAELITMTIGGNDIMKIVKKELFDLKRKQFDKELIKFRENYNNIMKEIRMINPEVPIILIGLYNPFSMVSDEVNEFESIITEWNQTIEEISNIYENACFVNVQDLFDTNANLVYHTDFFHPNGNGYTIMTERIISNMKSCQIDEQSNGLILFD